LHRGAAAPNPAALMRSRYAAFVLGLKDYLLATWHPRTRPKGIDFDLGDSRTRWLGLRVLRTDIAETDEGTVEFVARYRVGGQSAVRLHETSRFVRESGVWLYVDGVFKNAKSR
jgi:SEC-C motif-containing protein